MHTSIPHFVFPFEVDTGSIQTIEQDTDDEIAQCVGVLLLTELGERIEVPSYGITDPTFRTTLDHGEIRNAIDTWEPRAHTLVSESIDPTDELVRIAEVRIRQRR